MDGPMTSGWGPDRRRAALCLTFEQLAGDGVAEVVTPALPALLQMLGDRDLAATFFVEAAAVEQEPLAATLIANARNKVAALVGPGAPLQALDALDDAGREPRGVLAPRVDADLLAALTARRTLRYVAAPDAPLAATPDGILQIPVDRASAAATYLAPEAPAAGGVPAWHQALQLAVARAIERRSLVALAVRPGLVARADALAVLAETLDLIAGLRRAERLWVPTLEELAEWWDAAQSIR